MTTATRTRTTRLAGVAVAAVAAALALAGCDVRTVSWTEATFSTRCLGATATTTLHHGSGQSAPVPVTGFSAPVALSLAGLTVGALRGPHTVDEAVLLDCTVPGTNAYGTEVQVFASTPGNEPVRLLDRVAMPNLYPGSSFAPQVDRVLAVRVGTAELLQVSAYYWGPGDPHCCPTHHVAYTFHWDGRHFV